LADTPGGAGEGIPESNEQKSHEDEDHLFLAFAETIFWTMKGYLLAIKLAQILGRRIQTSCGQTWHPLP
jgi:hypothetical protein